MAQPSGGWTDFAHQIEQAGADALELNIYHIPTDRDLSGAAIEQTYVDIVKAVQSGSHDSRRGQTQPVLQQHGERGQAAR